MPTPEKILEIAKSQIDTIATGKNNVKYNTEYYGRAINEAGYAWCAVFVWWCFKQAGASELYYSGGKTAHCPTLLAHHKSLGQAVTGDYKPGDIVFFNFSSKSNAAHVGICERWDGTNMYSIDGNTSSSNEANGGTVNRRTRGRKYVVGGYRPAYQAASKEPTVKEVETMTQEQFNTMLQTYFLQQAKLEPSDWAKNSMDIAVKQGLTDGTRPQSFATRQELMQMLLNLKKTLD